MSLSFSFGCFRFLELKLKLRLLKLRGKWIGGGVATTACDYTFFVALYVVFCNAVFFWRWKVVWESGGIASMRPYLLQFFAMQFFFCAGKWFGGGAIDKVPDVFRVAFFRFADF